MCGLMGHCGHLASQPNLPASTLVGKLRGGRVGDAGLKKQGKEEEEEEEGKRQNSCHWGRGEEVGGKWEEEEE